jgi:hypothetical protein
VKREGGDQAIEVANMQRQSDGRIKAIAVPPNIVAQPIEQRENAERPSHRRFMRGQPAPGPDQHRDQQEANANRKDVKSAIRNKRAPRIVGKNFHRLSDPKKRIRAAKIANALEDI